MNTSSAPRLGGFSRAVKQVQDTWLALVLIGGVLWGGLTFALDHEYAPKSLVDTVAGQTLILEKVQTDLAKVRMQLIQKQLIDTKARSCNATSPEAKQHFAAQLQVVVNSYKELVEGQPFIPRCQDLQ